VPTIVIFSPLAPPTRTKASGDGKSVRHACRDNAGKEHEQSLPLGSVNGVFYLDALCLHCGSHLAWLEDEAE